MKNSTKRFVALLLLLVGLVGYLGGAGEIVMAEESAWTKEDFLYSNDTTIIAFSEQGMEKSKTMKTLSSVSYTHLLKSWELNLKRLVCLSSKTKYGIRFHSIEEAGLPDIILMSFTYC